VDQAFLKMLDTDKDNRIRAEEIKDGIRFLLQHLTDYSGIKEGDFELILSSVNQETELGRRISSSAAKILNRLQASEKSITLAQVREVKREVVEGGLDQAGIVLSEAADNPKTEQCIADIIRTTGGKSHPNGSNGVDKKSLELFFTECQIYHDWLLEAGEIGSGAATNIMPLGRSTSKGCELFQTLSNKLTQYFLLCDIKRLSPGLIKRALTEPEENIALKLIQINEAELYLKDAPLTLPSSDGTLDLTKEVNPFFREMFEDFIDIVVKPLMGEHTTVIDKQTIRTLTEIFTPFISWKERKPEVCVDQLESQSIHAYLSDTFYKSDLEQLIAESHRTAIVLDNINELERLLLYQAYMLPLTNSFVSFPNLYDPDKRALFEEGTLIMDGRHFTLAISVDDREHHIETCKGSNIFIIYCELYGMDGDIKHEIAVPVTSGNRGTIRLNKWGIFNDINGNELHAKIVDILENPISVGEAVIDPFIRINRAFFSKLEQFSSKAEERLFQRDAKKDKDNKKKGEASAGILAGGGVAIAAVGSSFAFITKTLAGLTIKTVFLALLVVASIIVIPAGIAAYFKLSRRDLSTVLEGSGWGINSRMKLTSRQATFFTFHPKSPTGAKQN